MTALDLLPALRDAPQWNGAPGALVERTGARCPTPELVRRATRLARGFAAHGVERGARVLFAIRPSIDAIATLLALTEVGAVIVAAPLDAGDDLFANQMRLVQPQWVVAESAVVAAMRSRAVRWLLHRSGHPLPALRDTTVRFVAAGRWWPGVRDAIRLTAIEHAGGGAGTETGSRASAASGHDDGDALIVFTSGTTASPRAVVHTRASLAATLRAVGRQLRVGPGDRLLARDLHLIVPALLRGAQVHLADSTTFDAAATARRLADERISHLFEVTAHVQALATHYRAAGRTMPLTLRQLLIGAAPVPAGVLAHLRDLLPATAEAWVIYGMTEMLPIAAITADEKLAYDGDGDLVGAPLPDVVPRIDAAGVLHVRGPHLFHRYLGHAPVREHATGDLARMRDGRVVLLGRSRDMIIRGAFNLYPALYESTIERIAAVRRCALVGVTDEGRADERVVLFIEPTGPTSDRDAARLARRVRAALRTGPFRIDRNAWPDHVHVLAALPRRGRSAKIDRQALRARAASLVAAASRERAPRA